MMNSIEHFLRIRGNTCENCGAEFTRENRPERHHCLFGRDKRFPELDQDVNIELLGYICCHRKGKVNSQAHAEVFAKRQIARGYNVRAWVHSLPLKYIEAWLLNL